jgi:hypothetical protein
MNQKLGDIVQRKHERVAFILCADKLQKFNNSSKFNPKVSLYEQLMTLKQIYGKIFDVCNLINDVFGWSLLFIVRTFFIAASTINHITFFIKIFRSRSISLNSRQMAIGCFWR